MATDETQIKLSPAVCRNPKKAGPRITRISADKKRRDQLAIYPRLSAVFPSEGNCITDFRSSALNMVAGNARDLRKSEKSVDRSSFSRIIHRLRRFSQIHIKLHQNAEITAQSPGLLDSRYLRGYAYVPCV